jgi:LuxR family transcriptional regulator, maltose regulon positive regulatory protein
VREQAGQSRYANRPGLGWVASKVRRPPLRPGTVIRSSLIDLLRQGGPPPVVSVVAPSGYGKTTLLSQWAERDGRSFAWVSADERDNDPKVLLTHVAEALDAVEPIDGRVFDALASPGSSVPGIVLPRLGSAFSVMTSPVVLVLDDVHALHDVECRAALSMLADCVPGGSRLVFAGQAPPPLRIARLRTEGRILEIGPRDLSLTRDEASLLLRNAGIAVDDDDLEVLYRRTEGWPAGLYLAALCLREGGSLARAAASFGGDDRFVSEYLESEFLARISPRHRSFLTRTAVLDQMSGPLCEAVLQQAGSGGTQAELASSNLLLVPLDRRGLWYRYHRLFRDMLLAQLHRTEPDLVLVMYRRAAEWHERQAAPGEALEYWMKAGEVGAVARLAGALAFPAYQQGRPATAGRWLRWLEDHGDMENYPVVAVLAGLLSAVTGKPAEAERWVRVAERGASMASLPDGSATIEPWLALLRAYLCRDGPGQMLADAELAAATLAIQSFWRTSSILLQAMAHLMVGDPGRADALFADAIAEHRPDRVLVGTCLALAERSLLAASQGAWDLAEQHLSTAQSLTRQANYEDYPLITIVHAVAARVALHHNDPARARDQLTRAQRLRPGLNHALPHLAVQARIELARCHLALSDIAAAKTLLREIDEIRMRRPELGTFIGQAEDVRTQLSRTAHRVTPGASALTTAELRLLPLLSTHLSFPEIAREMFLSPNTIKSEAYSIYRKIGASSRSHAVTRSRELGLIDR